MKQSFDIADKDHNKALNEEEFTEFITALKVDNEKRGNYEDERPGTINW